VAREAGNHLKSPEFFDLICLRSLLADNETDPGKGNKEGDEVQNREQGGRDTGGEQAVGEDEDPEGYTEQARYPSGNPVPSR